LQQGWQPDRLVYYSLDDPALFRPGVEPGEVIESLMVLLRKRAGRQKVLLLLDEVQRLDRWELFLKKYYDLNYPIRFVISGSASSPIFKKSRESLLGRVKDYHLLPFSFREFLLYGLQGEQELLQEMKAIRETGQTLMGMLAGDPKHLDLKSVRLHPLSDKLWENASAFFNQYIREGGFPEVWQLTAWEQKIDYLYDNQVKKVIYEDLVLAAQFRKPELLKRFYLSLLEKPGREVNLSSIANETKIDVQQAEKYLPLLEMTDLVAHVEKFRKSPLRVRRGNIKFYLVDLALRNAVLRLREDVTLDAETMGYYAENLVFNALHKWRGTVALDYYRDRNGEIDFIVHTRPHVYLPVEVKYRESIEEQALRPMRNFSKRFRTVNGIVVTKLSAQFGWQGDIFFLPLPHFLLLFD
jgi:predicted AAA+ superfamily ATPase